MSFELKILLGLTALVVLVLAPALHATQDEPVLNWHTFMGSSLDDAGRAITLDPSGNIYLTGWSDETWGTPIHPHSGGRDAFAARLNSSGGLEWNTFMGSSFADEARSIVADGIGNIYVVGTSDATWGMPGDPFPNGAPGAFVAKLNSDGQLLWHRFMTTNGGQIGRAVDVDALGNVYVGGWGGSVWDTPPVEPFSEAIAAFVAKVNPNGMEVWHAMMGSEEEDSFDSCRALAVDASGNVYVAGWSTLTWGSPINPHAGDNDAFAAKLNSSGFRQWNTFMGSSDVDFGSGITLDGSGNVYVSGDSEATWGSPVNPHVGGGLLDAFAAKLDSSGARQWHTFMGWDSGSLGWAIAADRGQNVYVAGVGGPDGAYVSKLNNDGLVNWNIFLRGIIDEGNAITVDSRPNVYIAGWNDDPWGTPINPHAGGMDAFVATFRQGWIFGDGFESGDTSSWSGVRP